jgi:hypothetical protein
MIDPRALELAKKEGYRPHGNWQHMFCDYEFWNKLADAINADALGHHDPADLASEFFEAMLTQPDNLQSLWNELFVAPERTAPKPESYKPSDLSTKRIHALLKERLGEDIHASWFSALEFASFDGERLIASVPVKFLQHWIEEHYYADLFECCANENEFQGLERIDIILRHPCMSKRA